MNLLGIQSCIRFRDFNVGGGEISMFWGWGQLPRVRLDRVRHERFQSEKQKRFRPVPTAKRYRSLSKRDR